MQVFTAVTIRVVIGAAESASFGTLDETIRTNHYDTLPLTEHTGNVLSEWIQERRHLEAYDGTTRLWLNNADDPPYKSASLCYLVRRLCDEADIPRENRKIVWYSLRHNLGKSMEAVDSLSQASDQLRHSSMETTKGTYAKSSIEGRRNTLEKINDRAKRTAENPDFHMGTKTPQRR